MNKFRFKLFISGDSWRGREAVNDMRRLCEKRLGSDNYELTVIDVLESPEVAEQEKIFATPTLVKELPPPRTRIIGSLSDEEKIVHLLELPVIPTSSTQERSRTCRHPAATTWCKSFQQE